MAKITAKITAKKPIIIGTAPKKKSKRIVLDATLIPDIQGGISSRFWQIISKVIQDEVDDLSAQVLSNDLLDDVRRERLRKWRQYLVYLLDLPEDIIRGLEAGKDKPIDFEVYKSVDRKE